MGRERAAKLLAHFSPDETDSLRHAGSSIRDLSQDRFDALVGEMEDSWLSGAGSVDANRRFADLLEPAPEPELQPDDTLPPDDTPAPPNTWESFGAMRREDILTFLKAENASVVAFILLQIDPKIAAEILGDLDDENRPLVATAMVEQRGPSEPVQDIAAEWLETTFELAGTAEKQSGEPGRVADIVNRMSAERGDALLGSLRSSTTADRTCAEWSRRGSSRIRPFCPRPASPQDDRKRTGGRRTGEARCRQRCSADDSRHGFVARWGRCHRIYKILEDRILNLDHVR